MKISTYITLSCLVVLGLIATSMMATYFHEKAHRDIFSDYGISSTIKYNFNPFNNISWEGLTTIDPNQTDSCDSNCNKVQAEVEIEQFKIEYWTSMIFIGLMVLIVYNLFKEEKEISSYS